MPSLLTEQVVTDALLLSLLSSVLAAFVAVTVGIPVALLLSRMEGVLASVTRALIMLPMVLPPVVGGAALLFAFGRKGTLGSTLEEVTGLVLPYSLGGVVLANAFVALPFVVLTIEGSLRSLDPRFELAAASLGANEFKTTVRVVLPMVRGSLVAAGFLAWARALGEFGATITFAGNIPGKTQTLPLAVFVAMETDQEAALAMSVVLILISLGVLLTMRERWWPAR
ncbi:MAG: molybdate ABC transporter permease subunit [Acidimicrobiales bacterium]|nr:molybdate ABC transporter permease subunit [Acidimicrobiales bacterium]|tara:strand:+ start:5013 stop:5690 length:678 start_codon:yes stop_codon:yes gene_type:complete